MHVLMFQPTMSKAKLNFAPEVDHTDWYKKFFKPGVKPFKKGTSLASRLSNHLTGFRLQFVMQQIQPTHHHHHFSRNTSTTLDIGHISKSP